MIVAARLVRDRRWSTLWWALGFVGLTLFTVSLYGLYFSPLFDLALDYGACSRRA